MFCGYCRVVVCLQLLGSGADQAVWLLQAEVAAVTDALKAADIGAGGDEFDTCLEHAQASFTLEVRRSGRPFRVCARP